MDSFLGRLEGVALITGAASGIARECAFAFARHGASLMLVDRDAVGLAALVTELGLEEARIRTATLDVRDKNEIVKVVGRIPFELGPLRYVINAAGILGNKYDSPMHELDDNDWELVLDINLKAQVVFTREAVKIMMEQDSRPSTIQDTAGRAINTERGVIINFCSHASQHARSASGAPYIASKHALVGLTKSTAVTYAGKGIRCVAVAPGFISTPLIDKVASKVDEICNNIVPQRRPGRAPEVCDLVLFLCSERASYINGAIMSIDGGWHAT